MQIDLGDEQPQKQKASIRDSFEPDLNSNMDSEEQSRKQWRPRISTEDGMQVDLSDE
jgi:hypothetical protein